MTSKWDKQAIANEFDSHWVCIILALNQIKLSLVSDDMMKYLLGHLV